MAANQGRVGAENRSPAPLTEPYARKDLSKSHYERIDAPVSSGQNALLGKPDPASIDAKELAGEPIEAKLNRAPGDNAAIGGIKLVARNDGFTARPSGTENVYKIHAESFIGEDHLNQIQDDARALIGRLFKTT